MSDRDDFDFRLYSDDPEVLRRYYDEAVLGRIQSPWTQLTIACAGSAFRAAQALSDIVNAWIRMTERKQPAGEVAFLTGFNYPLSALGPLLSATLLPANALEALVRLLSEVALLEACEGADALRLALNGFDALPFEERLDHAAALAGAARLSGPLRRELSEFVRFRNGLAHPAPAMFGPAGTLIQHKRAKSKVRFATDEKPLRFPRLDTGVVPVDLSHVLNAIHAHDHYVDHVQRNASAAFLEAFQARTRHNLRQIRDIAPGSWDDLDELMTLTAQMRRWLEAVPKKEQENFHRTMIRRTKLKMI